MKSTTNPTLSLQLRDGGEGHDQETQDAIIEVHQEAIEIGFEGYGECGAAEGYGRPVRIELYEGKLRALVWADINSEDPTHIIDLNGAQEAARDEQTSTSTVGD